MLPSKPYPRNHGFSLIEVVASLMLVGTLLVTILEGHRQCARQALTAQKRLAAISVLDLLLSDPETLALVEPNGKVPGDSALFWRTSSRRDTGATALGAFVLRIELYDPNYAAGDTLSFVEMLAPGSGSARVTSVIARP